MNKEVFKQNSLRLFLALLSDDLWLLQTGYCHVSNEIMLGISMNILSIATKKLLLISYNNFLLRLSSIKLRCA
jgi:hypothetical protein